MHASVTFRTPDGARHTLGPGDIVGRTWTAALPLDDERVSEAHALVSLRGRRLMLLALRGLFSVKGKPQKSLELAEGQAVAFARGLALTVEDVRLPSWVLGLEGPGLPRQPLAGVCALVLAPHPRLVARTTDAVATFWSTGERWRVRTADGTADVAPGWALEVDGARFEAVTIPLGQVGAPTRGPGQIRAPLRLVCHWDVVHVHREGLPVVSLSGHAARLISELAEVDAPVDWATLAGMLWPGTDDRNALRRRWDVLLARTRRRLRDEGIRTSLFSHDGAGHFTLVLQEGDSVDLNL